MALIDLFTSQSLNQMFPSRLPGTAKGWDTSSRNREVQIDQSVTDSVVILPSNAMKLTTTVGMKESVVPCTVATDVPYGYVIYKAKGIMPRTNLGRIETVARDGQEMDFAFAGNINAGATVYWDPTTGFATGVTTNNIKCGLALETVTGASVTNPVMGRVEIQTPRV
jgi:hypothetical protein